MAFREKEFKPDMTATEVEVTFKCLIGGKSRAPGDRCVVPYNDALVLQGMGRATIIGKIEVSA